MLFRRLKFVGCLGEVRLEAAGLVVVLYQHLKVGVACQRSNCRCRHVLERFGDVGVPVAICCDAFYIALLAEATHHIDEAVLREWLLALVQKNKILVRWLISLNFAQ